MKLWITGARGMLGQDLCSLARARFKQTEQSKANSVLDTDREVDITDVSAVSNFISQNKPDIIINCAAYTDVDKAELEKELNHKLNALGPKILGEVSSAAGIPIIHISTDYALNAAHCENASPLSSSIGGSAILTNSNLQEAAAKFQTPYPIPNMLPLSETALIDPQNEYGRAKAEGELELAKANPKHFIIRTAWLYGINGKNFVKSMLNLMRAKDKISVVGDQFGNPTWTMDLANAILTIAAAQNVSPISNAANGETYGIYHFSGEGITSWRGFAVEIQKQAIEKKLLHKEIEIASISSDEWKSPAKRPLWSALNKTKIKKTFGIEIPAWQESLSHYLNLERAS